LEAAEGHIKIHSRLSTQFAELYGCKLLYARKSVLSGSEDDRLCIEYTYILIVPEAEHHAHRNIHLKLDKKCRQPIGIRSHQKRIQLSMLHTPC